MGRKCEVASSSGALGRPRGGRGERAVVRGAEVGSTDSHILHSRVDRPCIGKARLPFPGSFGGEQGGPAGGGGWEGAGGSWGCESPMWALVAAAGAGGQEGGLRGPTACAPSVSLAGLQPSPSSSFSLSPSSLNPLLPIWPPLTLASPEPLGVCSYEGGRGRGRGPFLNLLWASPGPRWRRWPGTQRGLLWPEAPREPCRGWREGSQTGLRFGAGAALGAVTAGAQTQNPPLGGSQLYLGFRAAPREAGLVLGTPVAGLPGQPRLRPIDMMCDGHHSTCRSLPVWDTEAFCS